MNSKKSKKKAKPQPTHTVVNKTNEIKEIFENVTESVNLEENKCIVETVCEVLSAEMKSEDAVPKKPKRNRGKKKKQDKEEELSEENKIVEGDKDICDASTLADSFVSSSILGVKVDKNDNADNIDTKCLENETLTPTTRKKKNKQKKKELDLVLEEQSTLILKEHEQISTEENIIKLSKLQGIVSAKKDNKKNKKKKRHDSEKSDKDEEISCTTAFQQFIESSDEKSHINPCDDILESKNTTPEGIKLTYCYPKPSETNIGQEMTQINDKKIQSFQEESLLPDESTKDGPQEFEIPAKEENKNMIRIKKEKKQNKEVYSADNKNAKELINLPPTDNTVSTNLVEDTSIDSTPINVETTSSGISEVDVKVRHNENEIIESLKAKAVIAKPVEKKRKGKQDLQEMENKKYEVCGKGKPLEDTVDKQKDNIANEEGKVPKDGDISREITSQDCQKVSEDIILTQELEVIMIPDNVMGKKRKKSPKIVIPVSTVLKEEIADVKKKNEEASEPTVVLPTNSKKTIIEAPIDIVSLTEVNIGTTQSSKSLPEPQSRKKGKKLPKVPLTPGVTDFTPNFNTDSKTTFEEFDALVLEKSDQLTAPAPEITTIDLGDTLLKTSTIDYTDKVQEKFNVGDIPFIDTDINVNIDSATLSNITDNVSAETVKIEEKSTGIKQSSPIIDNPKTEVETPTLDIIPDIHYPRSTSQGYDGNNNTVIREARPEELQLPSLKDTPVIQGSGETPIGTPKMITSDIIISEIPEIEKSKEKTDLKSKMLEVNRDMEELRMSIERSLAEFTAMEKSEENIETEYENRMNINLQETEKDFTQGAQSHIYESEVELKADLENFPETQEIKIEEATGTKHVTVPPKKLSEVMSSKIKVVEMPQLVIELSQNIDTKETIIIKAGEGTEESTEKNLVVSEKNKEQETDNKDQKHEPKCSEPNIPIYPARRENKGKNKKKKGRQDATQSIQLSQAIPSTTETKDTSKDDKKDESGDKSRRNSQEKSKQQANTEPHESTKESSNDDNTLTDSKNAHDIDFDPIENFEDALTSSTEDADINKSFDMIVNETKAETELNQQKLAANKPKIKITGPDEKPKEKVTPPKNLLGHPNIPASSSRTDYKKEKNKTPNTRQAKVKIKDSEDVELAEKNRSIDKEDTETSETIFDVTEDALNKSSTLKNNEKENSEYQDTVYVNVEQSTDLESGKTLNVKSKEEIQSINEANERAITTENLEKIKQSTQSQTENKKNRKYTKNKDSFTQLNENEEFVYKYSFRKVFLQNTCHVCKKELKLRVPCNFCNLLFYCSNKHKDEDYPQHQALCFAISTIGHLKDQKYIYADTKNITGQNYRLIRMQMILSCEKVLKRRLVPWEQEVLLYPRICAEVSCRQWKQAKLKDCDGCGQISYCVDNTDHLPKTHQRWCKSYSLYQKLVIHQQTKGRLEPKMPARVMTHPYQIPDKINEVLASMYDEKIDMNDIEYAALTQIATAPLTAAYGYQVYANKVNATTNGITKKPMFTIHVVGAELQFEADALNKWEVFFLHLRPEVQELKVVLISTDLNPSSLPLDLLGKIKYCENCRMNRRRVTFNFEDKKKYSEYRFSPDYCYPDLICAFNPSIQRSSIYKDLDTWRSTLNTVLRTKVPFIISAYTITEILRDSLRIKECVEVDYKIISEAKYNNFASVRPDRNFITDDEMPLLFKNYCFMIICGI